MTKNFEDLGATTSMEQLARRFSGRDWWAQFCEVASLNDEAPSVRLIDGSLEIEGDLRTGADPWAIVVDGALSVSGTLECFTDEARTSMLVVTGAVHAANLFFASAAQISVATLDVAGFVIGTWGDSGAWLSARGELRARGVLLDSHTAAYGHPLSAIVLAGQGWQGLVPDILDGENELFAPGVLDRGGPFLDFHAARAAAKAGRPVFNAEREADLRAQKGL